MDPNATLTALLEAMMDNDRESALLHIDALGNWLDSDGFLPIVRSIGDYYAVGSTVCKNKLASNPMVVEVEDAADETH